MESLVVLQIIHSSFVGLANLDVLEAWVCIFSPLCCSGFVKERWENLDTALNTFLRAVIQTTVLLLFLFWNRIGIFLFLLLLKGLLFLFWIVLKSHPLKSHPTQSFAVIALALWFTRYPWNLHLKGLACAPVMEAERPLVVSQAMVPFQPPQHQVGRCFSGYNRAIFLLETAPRGRKSLVWIIKVLFAFTPIKILTSQSK